MKPSRDSELQVDGVTSRRTLWGAGTTRTVRAHWALRELELDYHHEAIVPRTQGMEEPAFRAVSDRGKVPILEDDGLVIGESGAIVLYLADRYGKHGVSLGLPFDDFRNRAAFYDLSFFILTELDATALYVLRRHEGLPEIYGDAPTATRAAREYFARQLRVVERRLLARGPFLLGDEFRAPDLLLMTCLDWAAHVGAELPASFEDYRMRIAQRPAYTEAMRVNYAPLRQVSQ